MCGPLLEEAWQDRIARRETGRARGEAKMKLSGGEEAKRDSPDHLNYVGNISKM